MTNGHASPAEIPSKAELFSSPEEQAGYVERAMQRIEETHRFALIEQACDEADALYRFTPDELEACRREMVEVRSNLSDTTPEEVERTMLAPWTYRPESLVTIYADSRRRMLLIARDQLVTLLTTDLTGEYDARYAALDAQEETIR